MMIVWRKILSFRGKTKPRRPWTVLWRKRGHALRSRRWVALAGEGPIRLFSQSESVDLIDQEESVDCIDEANTVARS